jgi:16S rRNA (cytosine1402-N4)-methyltransferase
VELNRKAVLIVESPGHTPVLVRAVGDLLAVRPGEVVVDATVGLGGHAKLFAEALGSDGTLIGLDADPANLEWARRTLAGVRPRVELIHANFSDLPETLASIGIGSVDVLFADLGVSSTQLDEAQRGFSFQREGPLDMRMDPRTVMAANLVNRLMKDSAICCTTTPRSSPAARLHGGFAKYAARGGSPLRLGWRR